MLTSHLVIFLPSLFFFGVPGQAVVHEACSHYNTSQFQSERGNFQSTLSRILRERFDKLSADITDLQVMEAK